MEPQKTPRERPADLLRLLVPDWRPTAVQVLWAIRIALTVAIVLGVLAIIGYSFGITLWDWLRVLAVPITIGAAVPLLNWLQKKRELDVENQRAQDEALQAYIDQMGQLLLDKDQPLRCSEKNSEVRKLARARTLTVLARLDGKRKRSVMQFLYESDLINKDDSSIDLSGASMNGADLSGALLRGANVRFVHLSEANLEGAILKLADLEGAQLQFANLRGADLKSAILIAADLSKADLSMQWRIFSPADPEGGILMPTRLLDAELRETNLKGADLSEVSGFTNEELEQLLWSDLTGDASVYLKGTIMPNGQKYEDWLKDTEKRQ